MGDGNDKDRTDREWEIKEGSGGRFEGGDSLITGFVRLRGGEEGL